MQNSPFSEGSDTEAVVLAKRRDQRTMTVIMQENVRTPLGLSTAVAEFCLLGAVVYVLAGSASSYDKESVTCQRMLWALCLYAAYFAYVTALNAGAWNGAHVSSFAPVIAAAGGLALLLLPYSAYVLLQFAYSDEMSGGHPGPPGCSSRIWTALMCSLCFQLVEVCLITPLEVGKVHVAQAFPPEASYEALPGGDASC